MSKPALALWASEDGTGRAYKHPFRTRGLDNKGKPKPLTSPSVTTVLKLVEKSALNQWAADKTLEWAIENASLLMQKSDEDSVRWGKYRWRDARDERAEVGTGIHETIEAIHTGSWNFPELDREQHQIMAQWQQLNERYIITPKRSEFTVWNFTHDYAGTADGLWDIVDTWTGQAWEDVTVDIKTSNNIWPEHWVQLAALAGAETIMEKSAEGEWSEAAPPTGTPVAICHLKADKHELLIEEDSDLMGIRFRRFVSLREQWETIEEEKAFLKTRAANMTGGF